LDATFGKRKPKVTLKPATAPAAAPAASRQLSAFVLTGRTAPPSIEAALLRAKVLWPRMPDLVTAGEKDGARLLVDQSGALVLMGFSAKPYPLKELQPLLRSAIGWPGIVDDLNGHKAHAVVSVSHKDPVRAHMILSYLTAAVLEEAEGSGVLWTNTANLIPAKDFLAQCRQSQNPAPLLLWLKIDFVEGTYGEGRPCLLAFTRGLPSLGLLDYELVCSAEQFKAFAFPFLYRLAAEAIGRGGQEADGTAKEAGIGPAGGRIGLRFDRRASARVAGREVIRLTYVPM
jgi:hypothetical protein